MNGASSASAQTKREIDALLARFGLAPRQALGQHFLADPNIVERIVAASGVGPGVNVVEIGAGTGTLTRVLAATGAVVVAYELDRGLRPLLEAVLADTRVELRFANALDVNFQTDLAGTPWTLVANLPYNIGTPLVLEVLRHHANIGRLVVMLQKEVVDRLVAEPGTSHYGIPSIISALNARPITSFPVPRQVFVPPPTVESEVIVLDRIEAPPGAETAIRLAQAAFGQRRKMLRRSLDRAIAGGAEPALIAAAIDPTRRAETLTPQEFLQLAEVVDK